jgi:two-component system, NarL family, sensor histidine kinase UhpB
MKELACSRENERRKVAGELHDEIGQNLVLAKMKLGSLKNSLPLEYSLLIEEVRNLIDHTIKETRNVIHELYPQVLHELGLKAALEWLVERTQEKYNLSCVAEIGPIPKALKQNVQGILYQAVRELLVNVAKHASASRAKVILSGRGASVVIQVVDDGRGFDPHSFALPGQNFKGFGLFSIREHLANFGGNLHIASSPGTGTQVTITLPLRA